MRFSLLTGLFLLGPIVVHEAKAQQSGEIVLEELELTIRQGNRVRERKRLSLKDERTTSQELRKALKHGEKMESRVLAKPKLRFLNAQGSSVKEMELGDDVEVAMMTASGPSKMKISRRADVAMSKGYAVVYESLGEPGEGRETGSVDLLNGEGDTVWQKRLPRYKSIANSRISTDGETIVTVQYWTKLFGLPPEAPTWQVVVYDKNGTEQMVFPQTRSEGYRLRGSSGDLQISPNGRYIALRAGRGRQEIVLFLDAKTGKSWAYEKASQPIDISDAGIARVGLLVGAAVESVSLPENMR